MSRRRSHLWLLVGLFWLIFAYATMVEPRWLQLTRVPVKTDGTPAVLVAQLSDLHLNRPGALEQRIFESLRDLAPDVIVLTGDVVDSEEGLRHLPGFLERLPQVPTIAVLGNWEHWSGIDLNLLRGIYQRAKVSLLVNESTSVTVRGRTLYIEGLDDSTAGEPKLKDLELRHQGDARILVQHSPGYFASAATLSALKFDLCMAGHTHGGQVTIFGLPIWLPEGSGGFVHGRHDHPMCPLYVSRGLGTSLLPLRLGARPEIVVFGM